MLVDGISSYNIHNITKDANGFLWISAQDELNKFDGNRFIAYKKNGVLKRKICGTDIRTIVEDSSENMVWVLPGEYGVNGISAKTGNVVATIPLPDSKPDEWNSCMAKFGDKLWIGTFERVLVYDTKKKKFNNDLVLPKPVSGKSLEVVSIEKDPHGNAWLLLRGFGIVIYDISSNKIIESIPLEALETNQNINNFFLNSLCFTNKTTALIGTSYGLKKMIFDDRYLIRVDKMTSKIEPAILQNSIECIRKDKLGNVFIASVNGLFYLDTNLTKSTLLIEKNEHAESDWLKSVQTLFIDGDNGIWLGCKQGLAYIKDINKDNFKSYYFDKKTNSKLEHVHSLDGNNSTHILAGLRNGIVDVDRVSGIFKVSDQSNLYHHIFEDQSSRTIVSRTNGLFTYNKGSIQPLRKIYSEFKDYDQFSINSHQFIGDSLVILGTENDQGILLWNYKKHTVKQINQSSKLIHLQANIVNKIYYDKRQNLWVLSDNNISILSNHFTNLISVNLNEDATKIPLGLFFGIVETKDYYWLTSYGFGLLQLNKDYSIKRIYNTKDGLTNEGVYEIFNVGDTSLYITTNNGLSVFNIKTETFKNYYQSDGLHNNAFEEACGTMQNGLIYAGGVNGFTIIDPSKLKPNNKPPKIYINQVIVESQKNPIDTSNLEWTELIIPDDVLQTKLFFSGINWSNPERTSFAWRITERSNEWSNIGTQNFINLIGLEHGTYHFQVKAANEDGVWSEPNELVLIYLPKWYQTWWFKILVALSIGGLVYAFYRYRIRQIEKQHAIRKSIATDLHDDLGSTLNSVKVFTNLAISGIKQEESLQQVKENLNEATMGLRDMLWVLDDSLDTVDELVTRLKQFAIPVTAASNIDLIIEAPSEVNERKLSKEEKRNLFLICKEAINNSIKYAEASEIKVNISPAGKKIQITLADNGKGFDIETIKKGYGLKNMQYRAVQIKYAVTVGSIPVLGTTVTIRPA